MSTEFHSSIESVRLSPIVAISEQVRKEAPQFEEKTGKKFVLFQRGELDFRTPQYIIDAAKRAMDDGLTKYPKSGGEDVYKDAVIAKLRDFNKAEGLTRSNVVCTYGGQEGLELAFRLFTGKKGAGFAPCWSCVLENFVPYAEIDFQEVPLLHDFRVDYVALDRVLNDVSFFYLNTPHNPTGRMFSEEEVRTIVDMCTRRGVYVISDESYERITYDGRAHFSPISISSPYIIASYTLSKTYAMTGWRLGYVVTRNERIPKLLTLADYTQTAGVVTFLQHAAAAALSHRDEEERALSAMMAEFGRRRDLIYDGIAEIPGIRVTKPDGAFYLFPNFSELIPRSVQGEERKTYVYQRLMEKGVATVFGACFGRHFVDNIRLSFSTTPEATIREGLARIREVFA